MLEARLVAITGDADPVKVAGEVVGDGLTINELAGPPVVFGVNATEADPLLYARPFAEGFVATTEVGVVGEAAIANHPFVV